MSARDDGRFEWKEGDVEVVKEGEGEALHLEALAPPKPRRRFWYHPDRQSDVDWAVAVGKLVATPEQLVQHKLMPLTNDKGDKILGWWVDESKLELRFPEFKPLNLVDDRNSNFDYAAWKDI